MSKLDSHQQNFMWNKYKVSLFQSNSKLKSIIIISLEIRQSKRLQNIAEVKLVSTDLGVFGYPLRPSNIFKNLTLFINVYVIYVFNFCRATAGGSPGPVNRVKPQYFSESQPFYFRYKK